MNTKISDLLSKFSQQSLSQERKEILHPLIAYIKNKQKNSEKIRLNFICTHNSRRSHLAQIWAQTMAFHFKMNNVECYSGGTEATAMFTKVAETLQAQGFEVFKLSEGQNPVYAVKFDENEMPIVAFSKKFDHPFNPATNFCAIMTCSSADEGCPFIAGAEKRIPIRYEDPKISDGTPEMDEEYLQKSLEIAQEMFYVFSQADE